MELLWGEEGTETGGSLPWGWSLPSVRLLLFAIEITQFPKEPPRAERIAALCPNS